MFAEVLLSHLPPCSFSELKLGHPPHAVHGGWELLAALGAPLQPQTPSILLPCLNCWQPRHGRGRRAHFGGVLQSRLGGEC